MLPGPPRWLSDEELPASAEPWVPSLGWEGPLEKEMATPSRILAWEIPWTEEPGGPQSLGPQRVGRNLATKQLDAPCLDSHVNSHLFLEEAVAPTPVLFWKIPWAEEPGRLEESGTTSDLTFTSRFHALEEEMATHSSVLAWRIPGTGSLVGCHLWGLTESDTTEAA